MVSTDGLLSFSTDIHESQPRSVVVHPGVRMGKDSTGSSTVVSRRARRKSVGERIYCKLSQIRRGTKVCVFVMCESL